MSIVTCNGYVAGWLDTSIHDFLEVLPAKALSTKFALITCLDSNPNPASLRGKSPELKSVAKSAEVLAKGLLLPTEALLDAGADNRIFFGFDEVWFFPDKNINPKPESLTLVGPARINQERFNELGKWMSDNAGSMGLGGGEGLNFAVKAMGLVRVVLGHSIEQPEPFLATPAATDSR